MASLKLFSLATTFILTAAIIARADALADRRELYIYKLLKKALLTEDNVFALQHGFYPRDRFTVSEVYFDVNITVNYTNYKNSIGALTYQDDRYYGGSYSIRIMTNTMILQAYIEEFMPYLRISSDLSFYYLLSLSTARSNRYPLPVCLQIRNLEEDLPETCYVENLLLLFTRVRYIL